MTLQELSSNDQHELELFKLYLAATKRWDDANPSPSGLVYEVERARIRKKRAGAHASIYKQVYGEVP